MSVCAVQLLLDLLINHDLYLLIHICYVSVCVMEFDRMYLVVW